MSNRSVRHAGVAIAVLACGCASSRPYACPEAGGPTWRQLVTPHFVLETNIGEDDARDALADFERIEKVFIDLSPDVPVPPRLEVVLHAVARDELIGRGAEVGRFLSENHDVIAAPVIDLLALDAETRMSFQHELTHRFVHRQIPRPPVWLDEGLAQYFSTMEVSDGQLQIGKPAWVREYVKADLVPVEKLLSAGRAQFYSKTVATRVGYYETAYVFVHMLHGGPYRGRFARYVRALSQGQAATAAWSESFGDVPLATLDAALTAYAARDEAPVIVRPYLEKNPPEPRVREMSDAEVHLLWARIWPWNPRTFAHVEHDLAEARRQDPRSAEAAFWAGRLDEAEGKLDDAEREFDAAIAAVTENERFQLALAELHYERALGDHKPLESMKLEVQALGEVAHAPETLAFVARYDGATGHPAAGIPPAEAAVRADPTCAVCLDTLACLLFAQGQPADAAELEERAAAMVPEAEARPEIAERLERFRDAARKATKGSAR